jgi:hypothetical protein
MATRLIIVSGLAVIALMMYIWRRTAVRGNESKKPEVTARPAVDYSGSIGGTIMVGIFGLGYLLSIVFFVIGLVVR